MSALALDATAIDWPDWSSKPVLFVASGPSAKDVAIGALRGRVFAFAVKEGVELCPWADAVYGCDKPWWDHKQLLPRFSGLKMAWEGEPKWSAPGIVSIRIPDAKDDRILTDQIGVVGSGRNSGFQAVNLAVQFGMRRGILVGYDMTDRSGSHYYGRNAWPNANNPDGWLFEKWQKAFNDAAKDLTRLGIEIVNTSTYSALTCFRKAPLHEIVREWSL